MKGRSPGLRAAQWAESVDPSANHQQSGPIHAEAKREAGMENWGG